MREGVEKSCLCACGGCSELLKRDNTEQWYKSVGTSVRLLNYNQDKYSELAVLSGSLRASPKR